MKKSNLFFLCAGMCFLLGILLSSLTIGYNYQPTMYSLWLPVFFGILLAKKGVELNNVEHGRAKNYATPRTGTQKVLPYITSIIFAIAAIVLIIKNIVSIA